MAYFSQTVLNQTTLELNTRTSRLWLISLRSSFTSGGLSWLQRSILTLRACGLFLTDRVEPSNFGAQYSHFALVAYFSQTVLNRVFDKDYASSVMELKLGVSRFLPTTYAKTNAMQRFTRVYLHAQTAVDDIRT